MSQTPQHILDKIREAKEKRSKSLDLSYERLTQIPPKVFELAWLEELDLSGNKMTVVPPEIQALRNLKELDLRDNPLRKVADVKGLILDYDFYQKAKSHLSPQNIAGLHIRQTELPADIFSLPNLTEIDLMTYQLTSVPDSLTRLQNLTTLNLSRNKLTSLPDSLTRLRNLTILLLNNNHLTSLPDSITQLQNLTTLNLWSNKLTSVPDSLTRLQNLTTLNLSWNQLRSVPDSLTRLQNLTTLNLTGNQLRSVPDSLTRLQNLTTLNLTENQLTSLPDCIYELASLEVLRLRNSVWFKEEKKSQNQIKALSPKILQLTNLKELTLEGNPIETPPPEIVAKGVEAIKDYFRQLEEQGKDYIYEAKLLIVGEPGAGKTTLAKKIENRQYELDSTEKSTEGIDVIKWQFLMSNGEPFDVNIWDFGGQEIYHATHQFFLTKRSLYALVCDTRKEDTDFYYWLNVVELLSDNSPLLIIKNEKQERKREIPERQLRGQFTNFEKTFATNLATNRGLDSLLTQLKHYLRHLPHIGEKLPKTWVKVREALEGEPRPHISLVEYLLICTEHGFSERKDALQLSGYLHDLGVILHFQDDKSSLLYRRVILKPEWGTTAVYRVLDNKKVIANLGQFTQDDLAEIWHEPDYGDMLGELLELMLKFQLCYHIPAQKLVIAPQLLSPNQPDYEWDEQNNLILRYTASEFMPKGIITRFIVAIHHLIEDQKNVWRSGVILKKDNTSAEVIEYYDKREIKIRLSGQYKRDLMIVVTNELDKLFNSFHRLKYSKLIPCNCPACKGSQTPHFYDYEKLREFASYGRDDERCDNPPYHTVSVRALILDIRNRAADEQELIKPRKRRSTAKIRHALNKGFDDVALGNFCFDYFPDLYDNNSRGMRNAPREKINMLLDHCRRQPNGFGDLLEAVEEECDISDNERQELAPLIKALKEYLDG